MKPLSDYAEKNIKFSQTSIFKRFYELRAGDELMGTMQQKGFWGMKWDVTILDRNYEIVKPSCWKTTLEIRDAGCEMPFATFQRDRLRSRGTLNLPRGEKLKIIPHLFKGFCDITNELGELILKIKLKTALRDKAEVMFEKKFDPADKYPWILMIAYIIALEQKHQAAHAAH